MASECSEYYISLRHRLSIAALFWSSDARDTSAAKSQPLRIPVRGDSARRRQDHSQELAQDYVEMIAELIDKTGEARLTDLARGLGVTHVTANRTLKRLQRQGLVTSQPYRSIFLTSEGRSLAKESRDRHETVVRFLIALGVPERLRNPMPKASSITSAARRSPRSSGICSGRR